MRPWIGGLCLLAACGTHRVMISRPAPATRQPAPARLPPARSPDSSRAGELVRNSVVGPLQSLFRSSRRAEAYNVTSADEVADDAWWMVTGDSAAGPDTSAPWTAVSWRRVSALPVLTIRDATGHEYWLTFDAPEFPELATTAEIVTAQLYRAAGYHVPTVTLLHFDPDRQLAFSPDSLRDALAGLPRSGTRIRSAVHHLPGRALGTFSFSGHRDDDPADTVPHEQRRELRGLYVVAAWLNHTGLFRGTTLDVGIDDGAPAVRHYLLGLETTLDAAAGGRPKVARAGREATWDAAKIAGRLLTLGFFAVSWERAGAAQFDPGAWTPAFPNSAFAHRTTRDGYWGAKRVGGISNEQIAAAVWAAQPSDSIRARALIEMLEARRTATLRYWYSRVTPLKELAISQAGQTGTLRFRDLWVGEGLTTAGSRAYQVRTSWRSASTESASLSSDGRGTLRLPMWDECAHNALARQSLEQRVGWIDIRADAGTEPTPRALRIFVLCDAEPAQYRIVGWRY